MDAIYTYGHYGQDSRPRLQFPKRTGRRTTYAQWLTYQYGLHHDGELPAIGSDTALAPVFVNHGRWLWQCPACLTAVQVSETAGAVDLCCCPACFGQAFVLPSFPDARAEIEAELLRQPGYRHNAPFRNWEPGWSLAYLRDRTAAAQAKIAAGETFVRSASIGTPRTWAVGEVLTAANMNTFLREIQKDLIGTNGPVELLHGLRPGSFTTAQLAGLATPPDGSMFYDETLDDISYRSNNAGRIITVGLKSHVSPLMALRSVTVVTHDLGKPPILFQPYLERVQNTTQNGWVLGDTYFTIFGGTTPMAWHDVSSSSYTVFEGTSNHFVKHKASADDFLSFQVLVDNDPNSSDSNGGWGLRVIAFA